MRRTIRIILSPVVYVALLIGLGIVGLLGIPLGIIMLAGVLFTSGDEDDTKDALLMIGVSFWVPVYLTKRWIDNDLD